MAPSTRAAQRFPYPFSVTHDRNLVHGAGLRPESPGSAPTVPPPQSYARTRRGATQRASPYSSPSRGHHCGSPPLQPNQFALAQYDQHAREHDSQPYPSHHEQQYQTHPSPPSHHAPHPRTRSQSLQGLPPSTGQVPSDAERVQQFDQAFEHLSNLIRDTPVNVVRQVIRHHWETPVSGSQSHPAFLLNVIMREADSNTLSRAVRDSGQRMVKSSKQQIVEHLSAEDFDEVAETLLSKVGNKFLDMALVRRMNTASVRDFMSTILHALLLDNNAQDIEEEKPDNEQASRSMPPPPTPSIPLQPALSQRDLTPLPSPFPVARYASQTPSVPMMPRHGTESTLLRTSCPNHGTESSWVPPNNKAYLALTAAQREEFEMLMKDAEAHYGKLMREAMKLPEPEQDKQLSALKNQYNARKTYIRKKYNLTSGEKRSRLQIDAERERVFGSVNGPSLSGRRRSARSAQKSAKLSG